MNLLPQQYDAKAHLLDWRVGALFMEPGTGKTRVACELVNAADDTDFVLWVGPLRTIRTESGIASVKDEVAKWGGFKAPVEYVGVESIGGSDRIFMDVRQKVERSKRPYIVVDESLKIKNAEAKRTKRLLDLGRMARYKLILNGTPLSRNLLDLWSQMEFLSPKILGMSLAQFKNTFCRYTTITKRIGSWKAYSREFITGYENVDYLYSLIRHYVYECDLHLNIRQNFHTLYYSVGDEEREEYEWIKERFLSDELLEWRNNNIFLEMTQKMQHSYACTAEKFEVVDELFEVIPEEESIIFCKYVSSREECARRYPKAQVLSYQKEAFGLNLQQYRHTIYFDKIWDYALRLQSGRRTFRTGQEYDCQYYDLTGDVKLEWLIDRNIAKKVSMTEYFKGKTKEELKKEL